MTLAVEQPDPLQDDAAPDRLWRRALKNRRVLVGGGALLLILLACVGTMPLTLGDADGSIQYNRITNGLSDSPPAGHFTYRRTVTTPAQEPPASAPPPGERVLAQPGLYADPSGPSRVRLTWTADYNGRSTGWVLRRAEEKLFQVGDFETIARLSADAAEYLDQGLRPGQKYVYKLEAQDAADLAAIAGTDKQGRPLLGRLLLGGTISLAVGSAAAAISLVLGVGVGLVSGYAGGKTDAILMRVVDVMYGLPYVLLVILFKVALDEPVRAFFESYTPVPSPRQAASLVVLFLAIGLVSWLTMARVVRGQVLSLRDQPFIEAARAAGVNRSRIFFAHLLPNLAGPIIVYATLTVPQAILQESFLSFLGIGVADPLPSWGTLAADGLDPALFGRPSLWWQLVFPCALLAVTLLSLNFLGDGLRDLFDPRRESAKL